MLPQPAYAYRNTSEDKTVKLWEDGSGAQLQTLEGHPDSVNAVAFSPDGKLLASVSVGSAVKIWDASSGVALQTLEGRPGSAKAVAFSPNSKLLASGGADSIVKFRDASPGAALQTLKGHSNSIYAVAFYRLYLITTPLLQVWGQSAEVKQDVA